MLAGCLCRDGGFSLVLFVVSTNPFVFTSFFMKGKRSFKYVLQGGGSGFLFVGSWLMKAETFEEFRKRTFVLCAESQRLQLLFNKTVAQKQVSSASPTPCLISFFLLLDQK
uniref:Uncharacterized protein n=1 Tax=Mus musculus TaxID=10090 RepID=Q8C9Y9_MOUSE|nr:unnamed protein product [Mus musculus]